MRKCKDAREKRVSRRNDACVMRCIDKEWRKEWKRRRGR